MLRASVLIDNHFLNSSTSHLKAIQQVKEDQFSKFLAPLEIIVIPGFGPVYIKVMLVAMMISELRSSFSKGLDPKRIGPYDPNVLCYQNHPLGKHFHTVSPKSFPFQRKLRIADSFNEKLHSFSDAFKMYTEQKDYFYRTLNQETRECENDYFRLLTKDAIRNAWIAFQYQNDSEKGFKLIKQAFTTIQEAKKAHFRLLKKELILMKAFLLSQLNETSLAHFELQHLPKSMLEPPITFQEKEWAIKTLLGWGLEEDKAINLEKLSGFDMMLLWAKGLVQKIENSSEEISVLVKESLRAQPNFEHALYFLKYTKDNLALLHKYELEQELLCSQEFQKNCSERSYLTLEALQMLHQSFKKMIINIPNLDDLLSFYDNLALAELYLFALQGASDQKQLTTLYNSLLPKVAEKQSFWIETNPAAKISKKVVLIDFLSSSLDTCQAQVRKISELYPGLKMLAVCYPQKSLYQLGKSYLDQKVVFQLQRKIEQMDCDQSEILISVFCHQSGEKIAMQVIEQLAEEIQKKIRLTVISSVIGDQLRRVETTYLIDEKDRLALLAQEIFKNKFKNSFSLEESFYSTQTDKTIDCFYNIKFFNQFIN